MSFAVGGACLYFLLVRLVAWSLALTGWLCGMALGWFVQVGGTTFNFVHGLATLACMCVAMITVANVIKRSVRWFLGVDRRA